MEMPRPTIVRKYGKESKKSLAEQLFAELPRSPVKRNDKVVIAKEVKAEENVDSVDTITNCLLSITLDEKKARSQTPEEEEPIALTPQKHNVAPPTPTTPPPQPQLEPQKDDEDDYKEEETAKSESGLRTLTWDDVCPFGDSIEKIAEASYAEIYRITNERGISIIKAIRLRSAIKAQTKTQQRSGLVDEEPHSEDDLAGELHISEWLADIPGFVVYKERYIVRGKAPKALLETHQAFHRRLKRKDPDRLQFYPSPSRYLDNTEFLVVELGDAGTALEDFELRTTSQMWDIFLHTVIALARAEDLVRFEVSDTSRRLVAHVRS